MTEPLAVRIEAALTDWQRLAEAASPVWWSRDEVEDTFDQSDSAFIHANSPSSVLRLITGIREIAAMHSDVMDDSHTGTCSCESDYPCETVRILASMLGLEEDTDG